MQDFLQKTVLDFFLPNQCVICKSINKFNLCSKCLSSIPNSPTMWIRGNQSSQNLFIPKSKTIIQPLRENYLDNILSCTYFKNNIIRKSIHYLKYKNLPQISSPLASIMLRTLSQHLRIRDNIILCPVPLHSNRLKFRGYNQSLLLAEYLESKLHIPIYDGLYRIRDTPNQMKISDKSTRIKNMNNAFEVKYNLPINKANIILIDDVTTTLSTINQAAKAFQKQSYNSINALVLAH